MFLHPAILKHVVGNDGAEETLVGLSGRMCRREMSCLSPTRKKVLTAKKRGISQEKRYREKKLESKDYCYVFWV